MIALVTTLFWVGVHTVVSTLGLLPNGDISEVVVEMCIRDRASPGRLKAGP